MAENVKSFIPNTENARKFMKNVKKYSNSEITNKSVVGNLMSELMTKKFEWSQPIHDHVTQMGNLAVRLKSLGMDVNESFLIQYIINLLPLEFGQFQVNYNTIKENGTFKKLRPCWFKKKGD